MHKLVIFASALTIALGTAASAKPGQGQGHGNHGKGGAKHSNMVKGGGSHGKSTVVRTRSGELVPARTGGRHYALDARGGCPPGLAKKNNGCMPPGQARKLYNVGQRYNRNFGNLWSYQQIPLDLRSRYDLDASDRFYYNNGYLYQVDPQTMLVQQVVSALLR